MLHSTSHLNGIQHILTETVFLVYLDYISFCSL